MILTQEDAAQEAAADEERVVHEETAQMDRNVPMLVSQSSQISEQS